MLDIITTSIDSIAHPSEDIALRPICKAGDKDWDEILALAKDIRTRGLMNLFTVRAIAEGEYEVMDGNRRFTAIRYLKDNGLLPEEYFPNGTINVQVRNDVDEAQSMADQIRGNFHVKKTMSTHEIRQIRRIAHAKQWDIAQIAEYIGCSVSYIQKKLKLIELPEAVQNAVDSGKLSLSNADALGRLPAHLMEEHLENAILKPTADFAEEVAVALSEWKKEKQGAQTHKTEFDPEMSKKYLKQDEASILLEQAKMTYELEPNDYNKGFLDAAQKFFRLDEESVEAAKAEYEAKVADRAAKAAARKADREAKKLADAQKLVAEAGGQVVFE